MTARNLMIFSVLVLSSSITGCKSNLNADLVLSNINIIDIREGKVIWNQSVAIKDDRIIRIAPQGKYRFNAPTIVNGNNKYLIPGLRDMHVHIREYENIFFPLLIAHGVTGVRDMFNPTIEDLGKWKSDVNTSGKYKPKLLQVSSDIVDAPPTRWPGSVALDHPDSVQAVVERMKIKGADFIKIYDKLSEQVYRSIVQECNRQKIPFAGHVPDQISLEEAITAGQKSIEHLDDFSLNLSPKSPGYRKQLLEARGKLSFTAYRAFKQQMTINSLSERDEHYVEKLMGLIKENDCWPSTAIFNIFDQLSNRPYSDIKKEDFGLNFYPDSLAVKYREGMKRPLPYSIQANIRKLLLAKLRLLEDFERFEVPFLAGSDASPVRAVVPGISLHRELEIMSRGNISNATLLKSATLYPALFVGNEKDYGTVSENKIADLVILSGNPLEDISNTQKIEAVILNGKHLNGKELQKMLKEIKS